MKNKIVYFCFAFLVLATCAFADTVTLKSGKVVEGKIVEKTDKFVKIEFEEVPLVYFLDEVEKINDQVVSAPVSAPVVAPVSMPEQINETPVVQQESLPPAQSLKTDYVPEQQKAALRPDYASAQARMPAAAANKSASFNPFLVILGFGGIVFIILVIAYICFSICLYAIAKKTNTDPAWLAWVPIANVLLMCRIGGLNYWWALGILGSFVPFIGGILSLIFAGFLWYRIALTCNKPGWMGILAAIPLAGGFVIAYFAFGDEGKMGLVILNGLFMGIVPVIVVVIALLAAIAIPNLLRARLSANEAGARAALKTIATAQLTYRAANNSFATLSQLGAPVSGPAYIDQALGCAAPPCLKYGYLFDATDLTADNFHAYAVPQVAQTTGARSFCITEDGIVRFQQGAGAIIDRQACQALPVSSE